MKISRESVRFPFGLSDLLTWYSSASGIVILARCGPVSARLSWVGAGIGSTLIEFANTLPLVSTNWVPSSPITSRSALTSISEPSEASHLSFAATKSSPSVNSRKILVMTYCWRTSWRQHTVSSRLAETSEPAALEVSARQGKFLDSKMPSLAGEESPPVDMKSVDRPLIWIRGATENSISISQASLAVSNNTVSTSSVEVPSKIRALAVLCDAGARRALVTAFLVRVGTSEAGHTSPANGVGA
eukprot:3031390-Rhodomonas_salina.3